MKSLPYKITIDPGNVCNLRCPGCHTGIKHPEMIQPQMLSFKNYKTFLKNFENHALSIALYNWGEPFLNKDLFSMIDLTREKRIGTTLHSNFNLFSEKMAEDCVKSGLTHVYLSIDGNTQEAYSQYRVKGNIDTVFDHVKMLIAAKKRLKSKYPIVTWKFLVFEHNKHEVEDARKHAHELGVDSFEVFMATPKIMDIYDIAQENRNNPNFVQDEDGCKSLWSSIYVNANGMVLPCSLSYRNEESFGNLLENDLQTIWNNRNYTTARRMFTDDVPDEVPLACAGCTYSIGKKCHKEIIPGVPLSKQLEGTMVK
jgi:radical SAM protein with 4Fe4S-binding SPASM domain